MVGVLLCGIEGKSLCTFYDYVYEVVFYKTIKIN